jgi:hypothetical protein
MLPFFPLFLWAFRASHFHSLHTILSNCPPQKQVVKEWWEKDTCERGSLWSTGELENKTLGTWMSTKGNTWHTTEINTRKLQFAYTLQSSIDVLWHAGNTRKGLLQHLPLGLWYFQWSGPAHAFAWVDWPKLAVSHSTDPCLMMSPTFESSTSPSPKSPCKHEREHKYESKVKHL